MKRIVVFLIISLSVITLNAQKNYLGFNMGTVVTRNDFAATENLFTDGYALPGFTIEFDGMYFPVRFVGVGGLLGFGSLYGNRDLYLENMLDYAFNESTIPLYAGRPGLSEVDFESGFWNYVNLMLGPELALPIGRFQLGVRAMGGISMVLYPKRELFYDTGLEELSALAKGLDVSPGYMLGGNLIYTGRSGTGIRLSADYFNSSVSYDFEMNLVNDLNSYTDKREEKIMIETINITVGFFYMF